MFRTEVQFLVTFSILFCGVFFVRPALSQQSDPVLQLDRDCYPTVVISPSACTCRKTNPQTEGLVQWVFPNGTAAKQTSNPQNGSSTLTVESPYKYALNQSYICHIEVRPGQKGAELNHTAHFMFGPESASLKWAQQPDNPLYLCPSNETKELRLRCEVPSPTINPRPVYTAFIDGNRYGAYDRLPGQLVPEENVWRLEIVFKLNSAGNHTVSCHVRNMYYAANWFSMYEDIQVSEDQPPASYKC